MKLVAITALAALGFAVPTLAIAQNSDPTIRTAEKQPYGQYLVGPNGHALYMFTSDKDGMSKCYQACAQAWPPLQTADKPNAGQNVSTSILGTTKRTDGVTQVIYNGMPLYYFIRDQTPGATAGEGIKAMGGEWYLVSPKGDKIDND
jgi:predicted lipoprotein with Yx(FWY)xxD motif